MSWQPNTMICYYETGVYDIRQYNVGHPWYAVYRNQEGGFNAMFCSTREQARQMVKWLEDYSNKERYEQLIGS